MSVLSGKRGLLVLEEGAGEVDVIERVGDRSLCLLLDVGLHAGDAVIRHLLGEVLRDK